MNQQSRVDPTLFAHPAFGNRLLTLTALTLNELRERLDTLLKSRIELNRGEKIVGPCRRQLQVGEPPVIEADVFHVP